MGKVIIYNGGQRKMNFIKKKGLGIGLCIVLAAIATLLCKIQAGSFSFEIIGAPVFGILMGMNNHIDLPETGG